MTWIVTYTVLGVRQTREFSGWHASPLADEFARRVRGEKTLVAESIEPHIRAAVLAAKAHGASRH